MLSLLKTIRLPYREDTAFSILFFLILTVPLAFSPYAYENFEVVKYTLWMVLLGCALIVFFVQKTYGEFKLHINFYAPLYALLGIFLVWSIISTIFSVHILNSLIGFYYRFDNSLLFYALWSGFIVLLLNLITWQRFIFILEVIVFDALVISIVGILQSLGVGFYDGLNAGALLRAPSLLGNPNFSTMFIVCVLPVVVGLFFRATRFGKWYYGITALCILFCTAVLTSRGAMVALLVSLIFMASSTVALKSRKRVLFAAGILFVVSLGLWYGITQITKNTSQRLNLTLSEENINQRLYAWDMARQVIVVHPWVGTGLGNFQVFYERHRGSQEAGASGVFDDAHNLFLHMAATGGIPFALAFCAIIAIALWAGKSQWKTPDADIVIGLQAGTIAFIVAASFTPVVIPCFLLLGVFITGLVFFETRSINISFPKAVKVAVICIAVLLVLFGISFLIAEHLFYRAYNAYFHQDYRTAKNLTEAALFLNPTNQLYYVYNAAEDIYIDAPEQVIRKDIGKIVSIDPVEARTYIATANIYFNWYKHTGNKRFLNEVLTIYQKAIDIDPYFAERYGQMGYYYYEAGNNPSALQYTEMDLKLKPDDFSAWILLAKIYQTNHQKEQMIYALNKAFLLKPDSIQLKVLLQIAQKAANTDQVPLNFSIINGKLE